MGNAPLDELQLVEVVGVEPREDFIGLPRLALPVQCARQKLSFAHATAALERRARVPFTQRQVRQKHRVFGRCDEQLGIDDLVTVDAQLRQPDPAGGRVEVTVAQHLNEAAPQLPSRRYPDVAADDITKERVAEPGIELRHLCRIDGVLTGQLGQRVDV